MAARTAKMCIRDRATADTRTTAAATEVNGAPESHVINITANPVSYTHLDVYKRQVLY